VLAAGSLNPDALAAATDCERTSLSQRCQIIHWSYKDLLPLYSCRIEVIIGAVMIALISSQRRSKRVLITAHSGVVGGP
jgi:hypothetical protein